MKPRVIVSDLTGRAYVVTRYTENPNGTLVAHTKYDVTDDVVRHLMALAWVWNDCIAAPAGGDVPPNPYRGEGTA